MSWIFSGVVNGTSRVWLSLTLVLALTAALLMGSAAPAGAVAGYGDVAESTWYTDAVQWSVDNAITDIADACFAPDAPVSRGETAVWIHNMENKPDAGEPHSFTDVTDASQDDAISWMANNEITTGTSPTTFAPDETLRRAQVAAFLHRLAGEPSAPPHGFVDVVAGWQQDAVSWMSNTGITTGTSPTTFAPEDTLTRAHLVTFLYRYKNEPEVTLNTSTPDCDPTADVDDDSDMDDDFSAAFLYISPIGEAGWTWAHDQGRLYAEEATGIPTIYFDSVDDGSPADIEAAIRTLVADGHDVIIGTSFGYMDTMEAMAAEFPDVVFEHVSGYKVNDTNFGNTFGKIYQPRYLTGMIAGAATETNRIGYVAAFPIPEVARGINAFTLGAQRVNPDVEVVVNWTSTWFDPAIEGDAADALLEGGADVIAMHQDTTSAGLAAEAAGARWVSYNSDMSDFAPDAYLASAIWNWGPRYAEIISSAADGSYTPGFYWGGYDDGIVDIGSIAADVDADIVAQVEDIRQQMIDGTFAVFSGPLNAQDGTQLLAEGEVMDPGTLLSEAFFVQGVVGDIG